jgi:hypothetical protein
MAMAILNFRYIDSYKMNISEIGISEMALGPGNIGFHIYP